jgi:serine/threonine-protein kinase
LGDGIGQGGAILGRYRLIAKLGQGGMADVFLAAARGPAAFNKLVVIKRHRAVDAEGQVDMFLDEAKLSARLNHPNIVQTYEIGQEDGAYFIVMEYLDGQPLNRILKAVQRGEPGAEAFSLGTWIRIVAEALSGLHYAHELCDYDGTPLHIVHRDVSPHNLFVTFDGAVKIVDFGIAKAALNSVRTEAGILKGKVSYMAPEQATCGHTIERRADIFPVGILLWEILAGRRLFDGDAVSVLNRLVHHEIPPIAEVVPGVHPDLGAIVTRALAPRPEDRFATAQEMRLALEAHLRQSGDDVRGDDIAARMNAVFAERRTLIRQQIKACLDHAGADTRATLVTRTVNPTNSSVALSLSLPSIDESGRSGATALPFVGTGGSTPPVAVASASRRGYVVGGLGAIALGAASALVLLRPFSPAPPVAPVAAPAQVGGHPQTPGPTAMSGVVRVISDPPEAVVRWNGHELGRTPLSTDLPPGMQTLSLVRAGYQEETVLLSVTPGGTLERSITLRRRDDKDTGVATVAPSADAAAPEIRRPLWRAPPAPYTSAGPVAKAHDPAFLPAAPPPEPAPPAAQPAPPPTAAASNARPRIQIIDDDAKPAAKVNVVQ